MTNGITIDLAREADFPLGALQVRPAAREVEAKAGKQTLEPRVMQVLVALARRSPSVVSRDELIAKCWAGRVVGDDAIHRCIARLRRLAASYGGFVVETVPKVGYRLIPDEAGPPSTVGVEQSAPQLTPARLGIVAGAAVGLAAIAFVGWTWRGASVERAEQEHRSRKSWRWRRAISTQKPFGWRCRSSRLAASSTTTRCARFGERYRCR